MAIVDQLSHMKFDHVKYVAIYLIEVVSLTKNGLHIETLTTVH